MLKVLLAAPGRSGIPELSLTRVPAGMGERLSSCLHLTILVALRSKELKSRLREARLLCPASLKVERGGGKGAA